MLAITVFTTHNQLQKCYQESNKKEQILNLKPFLALT